MNGPRTKGDPESIFKPPCSGTPERHLQSVKEERIEQDPLLERGREERIEQDPLLEMGKEERIEQDPLLNKGAGNGEYAPPEWGSMLKEDCSKLER